MTNTDTGTQGPGWLERAWDKFHAWVVKNPGFYAGVAIGVVIGVLL